MNESRGAHAEHVRDCPGCVGVAREGLGHCQLEFGEVLAAIGHSNLQIAKNP